MADRQTIQRFPTGLLDLLGMQSTGDTPNSLAAQLGASVDIWDLYLSDRIVSRSISGSVPITTTGYVAGSAGSVVPAGQLWLVYGIGLTSVACTAGATVKGNGVIYRQHPGQVQQMELPFSVTAGELIAVGKTFERPMLMRPGDLPGIYVSGVTGAPNFNWTAYVLTAILTI